MKKYALLSALCVLFSAATALALPGSGGPTPSPTAVPIDGGASLLLASGVAFGLKKLRDRRQAR